MTLDGSSDHYQILSQFLYYVLSNIQKLFCWHQRSFVIEDFRFFSIFLVVAILFIYQFFFFFFIVMTLTRQGPLD